jgi:uncharacterized protein YecE (DUF72 family)
MEFGRIDESELPQVNFTLPPDAPGNKAMLKGKPFPAARVYAGCAKWGISEWQGKLYPPKTRKVEFLDHYLKNYNALEFNASHYEIFPPKKIKEWAAKAGNDDFLFCSKVPREITHEKWFEDCASITEEYLNSIRCFGEHLGPVLLQVSEKFTPANREELFNYLQSLPADLRVFVEVRNSAWFSQDEMREELKATLSKLNMGWVITDTAGKRHCVQSNLTIPHAFIRFTGNSLHTTDFTRIDEWVLRIKQWLDNGLQSLYFFMHMHDEAYSPELSVYLIDQLNHVCGLQLKKPKILRPGILSRGTPIKF